MSSMYITTLPDHADPGFDEKAHFEKFGKTNIIFHSTVTKSGCDRHVGCLSIKTVLRGEEWYGIDNNWVAVRPGHYLTLNNDQPYACRIDGNEQTEIFSVFFKKDFANSILHDSLSSETKLIDEPYNWRHSPPAFLQTLRVFDRSIGKVLRRLEKTIRLGIVEQLLIDQLLVELLQQLRQAETKHLFPLRKVEALKPSTKKEIYKRICLAKDLLFSHFKERNTLESIAQQSCLSLPQLIRQFKATFDITPHQYLTEVRLQHASRVLLQTSKPIQEICNDCGFENLSSFSRLFKIRFQHTPSEYRAKNKLSILA